MKDNIVTIDRMLNRMINKDEIHVNITFKIKYKTKITQPNNAKINQNCVIKQNNYLEGYTTVRNVALKYYRNINKQLSDFIREQPTFLSRVYFLYLQRHGKIIKQINRNSKVSQERIKDNDNIIIIDDMEIKKKLDELVELKRITLQLKDNKNKVKNDNNDFDIILKTFFKSRGEIPNLKEKKKKDIIKYILIGLFFLLILSFIGLGIYFFYRKQKKKGRTNHK